MHTFRAVRNVISKSMVAGYKEKRERDEMREKREKVRLMREGGASR